MIFYLCSYSDFSCFFFFVLFCFFFYLAFLIIGSHIVFNSILGLLSRSLYPNICADSLRRLILQCSAQSIISTLSHKGRWFPLSFHIWSAIPDFSISPCTIAFRCSSSLTSTSFVSEILTTNVRELFATANMAVPSYFSWASSAISMLHQSKKIWTESTKFKTSQRLAD